MSFTIGGSKFQEPNFESWRFADLEFNYSTTEVSLTVGHVNLFNIHKPNLNVFVSTVFILIVIKIKQIHVIQ